MKSTFAEQYMGHVRLIEHSNEPICSHYTRFIKINAIKYFDDGF